MTLHSPQNEVRDPRALWWWMRAFVFLTIVGYVITLALSGATWGLYARLWSIPGQAANFIDRGIALTNIFVLGTYIFSIIFTLRVTYRLMKNAHTFGGAEELTSPGMAVGWYFVPIASLLQPPRAVGQIWRATFRRIGQAERGSSVIGWWWMSWIVSGALLTYTGFAFRAGEPSRDVVESALFIQTIGYALRTVAAVFLLVTFGAIVRAQSNLDKIGDTFD
ncbi:MAG: DUF4328 domain-containing protein [Proteobacteria bacterium]|nr:DUF4328 domain-containing protein [Pseudomonadota bacterium]